MLPAVQDRGLGISVCWPTVRLLSAQWPPRRDTVGTPGRSRGGTGQGGCLPQEAEPNTLCPEHAGTRTRVPVGTPRVCAACPPCPPRPPHAPVFGTWWLLISSLILVTTASSRQIVTIYKMLKLLLL